MGRCPPRAHRPRASGRAQDQVPQRPGHQGLHLRLQNLPRPSPPPSGKPSASGEIKKEFRRLNILGEIYGDRLREEIREKLGASYSPNAGASGSDALEGVGYIIGQSIGKPEDLDLLLKTMRDLADNFANTGATADELDRAIKPLLGQLEKSARDNSYWLGTVMGQSQSDPERLDLARGRDADYRSITLAEINALAKKYLKAENALLVSIKPAG